jgi:hypothetical protein
MRRRIQVLDATPGVRVIKSLVPDRANKRCVGDWQRAGYDLSPRQPARDLALKNTCKNPVAGGRLGFLTLASLFDALPLAQAHLFSSIT